MDTGEVGEICLRPRSTGPYAGLFKAIPGYFENENATGQALEGGMFHTGDLGTLDESGFLTIVDRKKDMIICSGFNVFPAELERVILGDERVLEAYVVGVPDDRRVEVPMAYVVPRQGADITPDEVKVRVADNLASYKALHKVRFVPAADLPRNALGKVLKRKLPSTFEEPERNTGHDIN
jgi:acyl-CoA synthetase (AMP-forming)/AMP-acid ligase II